MKRIFKLLLASTVCISCFAQEKVLDNAYLKCQYKHTYLKDTLDIVTFDDLIILQVGRKTSKSYSYYSYQADSLAKSEGGDKVWKEIFNRSLEDFKKHRDRSKFLNSFPRYRSTTYVYKNYPEGKMTVTDATSTDGIIYMDSLNIQEWHIIDSTRTVLGYLSQKAECHFRGRDWTAWFAPDIPVSDGPWKFSGLPGLIMEVYDKGSQYYFGIVGIEKVDEPVYFRERPHSKGKYITVDRKEFLKAQMNRLTHGASFMESEHGISFGKDEPVYRDLIERDYK